MKKKEKICRFTIDIPTEIHKRLKTLAAIHEKSMRKVVIDSIEKQIQRLTASANKNLFKQS